MRGMNMAKEAMICLQLDYVHDFHCDGKLCNAQCCQKWRIEIDKATYDTYKKIKDPEWRKRICESIHQNKKTGEWEIALNREEKCPLLGDDLLCGIQRNLGEEYLSEICASYPRQTYRFQRFAERSLTLSCPVALRLAIRNDRPLGLEQISIILEKMCIFDRRNREDMNRYIIDLQLLTIPILQQQKITIWQRLQLLGGVIDIVAPYVEKRQDIPVAAI